MPFTILVAGDRHWQDTSRIRTTLQSYSAGVQPIHLLHGGARGADSIAAQLGRKLGFQIHSYPAAWTQHGRAAGPIRNTQMLTSQPTPDVILVFHDDLSRSRGTANLVKQAKSRTPSVPLYQVTITQGVRKLQ